MMAISDEVAVELLTDDEIVQRVEAGKMQAHALEKDLKDCSRAVQVRRMIVVRQTARQNADQVLAGLPQTGLDYGSVLGACCENVVGFVPVPVGIAGPLLLDGMPVHIPMATTEGCLVASTARGCRALSASGGVTSAILADGMTRAPVVRMPSITRAAAVKAWIETPENFGELCRVFDAGSRFARLQSAKVVVAGRQVHIRFKATTGDAMGMNMLTIGVERALAVLRRPFPDMQLLAVSGNLCTDKKASASNWLSGRGKSVVAEGVLTREAVEKILKTTPAALADLNVSKNLVGSAMAGALGGFNAHAANIVAAVFIATGQDPAQVVVSANCITQMELLDGGDALHVSVTMPSLEVGTIGGGTGLAAQAACLDLAGVRGPHPTTPGANAKRLASIIAGAVLAGELSLMAALAQGTLASSHMRLNRSSNSLAASAAACHGRPTSPALVTLPVIASPPPRSAAAGSS
jgi:hydroxymethylglutaryl-CoA reductase (NADPH)